MKPALHAYLCDDNGHRFFGNGPMRLLQLIGETGSLRCAAQQMGLSYSKALAIVKRAEADLGFALTEKTIGGRGGGGSRLTPEAETFLHKYEVYRDACSQANREIYHSVFEGQP